MSYYMIYILYRCPCGLHAPQRTALRLARHVEAGEADEGDGCQGGQAQPQRAAHGRRLRLRAAVRLQVLSRLSPPKRPSKKHIKSRHIT